MAEKKKIKNLFAQAEQEKSPMSGSLGDISKALMSQASEGVAQEESAKTEDPNIQAMMKRMAAAKTMQDKLYGSKDESSGLLEAGLLAALPTVLGSALGGPSGAMAGVQAGQAGLGQYQKGIEAEKAAEAERAKQLMQLSGELEKAEATKAESQLQSKKLEQESQFRQKQLGLQEGELALKRKEQERKATAGVELPEDKKEIVSGLAKKNAVKISIANQIDQTLNVLDNPKIDEDQKIAAGRTLLKTLNSSEGADAIGVEEAKRLGSFLEFKVFNLTQPGSFVGRDVDQFGEQARIQSQSLKQSIMANQAQIDALKSGQPLQLAQTPQRGIPQVDGGEGTAVAAPLPAPHPQDQKAIEWAKANPKDPRAKAILQRFGL
jgi:hypothetical protein